jgi:hypothetical protein
MRSRVTDRRRAPKCQREWSDQALEVGLPEVPMRRLVSVLQGAQKNLSIHASSGFIRGIPANVGRRC